MGEDYYKTLGIDKNADEKLHKFMTENLQEEFRKNERRALSSFRYHVFKWRYNNEDNFKEYFDKLTDFIDNNMAYCKYCKLIADIGKSL